MIVLLGAVLYASLFTLGVLPRLGFAPGYVLSDASGNRVTSEDMRGSVSVYTFASRADAGTHRDTHATLDGVQHALTSLDLGEIPVKLVTIDLSGDVSAGETVTPEGVQRMLLRGPQESLRPVVRDGFGVWYDPAPDGSVRYDPAFVVVDGLGVVRSRYTIGMPDPEIIAADVHSIIREARAVSGAARIAYEAAHLFQCYPSR